MKDRIPKDATAEQCAGWWLDLNDWHWPDVLGEPESREDFEKWCAQRNEGMSCARLSQRSTLMRELAMRCTDRQLNEEADKRYPGPSARHVIGGPWPVGFHDIKAER